VRTVYLGTSDFAAGVLRRLADTPHRPALVVTRPDKPRGRGRRLSPPPVAVTAAELGIETFQPVRVNDDEAVERVAVAAPDAVLLCAFGAIIREPLLSRFGPILNVHPSLLPRWRGAAPVERAIMAGDGETGVSIMAVGEGLDDGPVCLRGREPIGPGDTYATLAARLEALGARLLVRALDERPRFAEQSEDGATYAEKIGPADRTLEPEARTAAELERVVRALTPHVGARIVLPDGTMLGVRAAAVGRGRSPEPGRFEERDGTLVVGTRDGPLELREVQPPGGRPMPSADYLRGRPLPP
jgi:methionyl-tRNA formyltransferase